LSDLIPGIAVAPALFPNAAKSSPTALRELAMRAATGRVDAQLRYLMAAKAMVGPWPTQERARGGQTQR
jgi:hypothetical protein